MNLIKMEKWLKNHGTVAHRWLKERKKERKKGRKERKISLPKILDSN